MSKNFKFDPSSSKEIGLHCGTLEQSNNFSGTFLYRLTVDTSKMFTLNYDVTSTYGSMDFLTALRQSGTISADVYDNSVEEIRTKGISDSSNKEQAYSKYYRDLILSMGYTGFIYPNEVEGEGDSVCIVDSATIKSIDSVSTLILNAVKSEIEPAGKCRIVSEAWGNVTINVAGTSPYVPHNPILHIVEKTRGREGDYNYIFDKVSAARHLKESYLKESSTNYKSFLTEGTDYAKQASKLISDAGLFDETVSKNIIDALYREDIHAFNHAPNWLSKYLKGIARMLVQYANGDTDRATAFSKNLQNSSIDF